MKKKNLILIVFATFLLSSCAFQQKMTTTKMMDIYGAGVVHKPTIVDLEVKEVRVTGTSNSSKQVTVESLKTEAVSNALQTANADVLIEPKFDIELKGSNKKVTVTGFPATYKNFRPITHDDVQLFDVGIAQKANEYTVSKQTKPNAGKVLGLTLGSIALIVLTVVAIL
jgi:hypothetical protein